MQKHVRASSTKVIYSNPANDFVRSVKKKQEP